VFEIAAVEILGTECLTVRISNAIIVYIVITKNEIEKKER
jgi:hypothetical protein